MEQKTKVAVVKRDNSASTRRQDIKTLEENTNISKNESF